MFFDDLIGLQKTKKKLNFYFEGYQNVGVFPHILLTAGKGGGKTEIAERIGRGLQELDKGRKFCKVNSSGYSSVDDFFNDALDFFIKGIPAVFFFDECHALPKDLQTAFLTILNPNKHNKTQYKHGDDLITIDFKKFTFIFATTNAEKMLPPLVDRLKRVVLEPYTKSEIAQIIRKIAEVEVPDHVAKEIAETLRGNARAAIDFAHDLNTYSKTKKVKKFYKKNWLELSNILTIQPLGLSEAEIDILRSIEKYGKASLTALAARTGLEKAAVQRDYEPTLLRHGLIEIRQNSGRILTTEGKRYLTKVKV